MKILTDDDRKQILDSIRQLEYRVALLEKFAMFNINDTICRTFEFVLERPEKIQKWRYRTSCDLYHKAVFSIEQNEFRGTLEELDKYTTNDIGDILNCSGYFEKPIRPLLEETENWGNVLYENGEIKEQILNIDRQICTCLKRDLLEVYDSPETPKTLAGEFCNFYGISKEARFRALEELNKPLKSPLSKKAKPVTIQGKE